MVLHSEDSKTWQMSTEYTLDSEVPNEMPTKHWETSELLHVQIDWLLI